MLKNGFGRQISEEPGNEATDKKNISRSWWWIINLIQIYIKQNASCYGEKENMGSDVWWSESALLFSLIILKPAK